MFCCILHSLFCYPKLRCVSFCRDLLCMGLEKQSFIVFVASPFPRTIACISVCSLYIC